MKKPNGQPRHWVGVEELENGYWEDEKTRERRGQEFHDKPIETLELIEKLDRKGIARRDFLTIMGAGVAMSTLSCARRPVHKIIPYVVKPEEISLGVPLWYASTWREGTESLGILVKTREGRPIKIEGNPDHPVNRGKLSARAQGSLLELYDPERLKNPMLRDRGAGSSKKIAWSEADALVRGRLKAVGKASGKVRVVTETVGPTTRKLIREFLSVHGDADRGHVEYSALAPDALADGQLDSHGARALPLHHFDKAEVVLSLSSDFLATGPSPVESALDWSASRKLSGGAKRMSKLIAFESAFTVTGANADLRFPVRAGDELLAALAVAHEIVVAGKRSRYATDSSVAAALAPYSIEAVAAKIEIKGGAESLRETTQALWNARGRSLVVAGGTGADSRKLQIAAAFLNSALENEGSTIESAALELVGLSASASIESLIRDLDAGRVDLVIFHQTNPAFTFPRAAELASALKKAGMVIHSTVHENETSMLADLVLPDHHFLEGWGDDSPRPGILSIQQPVIAPLHDSRSFQDGLLAWMEQPGTWYDYLKTTWKEGPFARASKAGAFDSFWEASLRTGVHRETTKPRQTKPFRLAALSGLEKVSRAPSRAELVLFPSVSQADGRSANNAWLQELPDPITTATWDNTLCMSKARAAALGLRNNDVVEITTESGKKAELPVLIQPGLHNDVVTAAFGFGRRVVGKVGMGSGSDLFPMAESTDGRITYSGIPVRFRKTGRVFEIAITQWHHVTENRPVVNDISLDEYLANPGSANHTDPHVREKEMKSIWTDHEYKGHRWGMAIDLSSCIGCNACVLACQAENNVPVVGREQVRFSREMHWIRLDRYYSGTQENPEVVFQPMLCQHCENAPCETVCPVLATVHSSEGLNEQVYNRCVGTRYCQNNCPYKARRFNFFDHWMSYDDTMNLVWNPDVTVRTRGIMEKCTFCVQRIRSAKEDAKARDGKLRDGEAVPACAQTCPTDAIVFGDINDPNSRAHQLQADARSFRAIESVNALPQIAYLSKVRNRTKKGAPGKGHHA